MHHQLMLIVNNVDELRAVSEATKPDIICIVETWLDKHIPNNKFFSQTIGYSEWTEIDMVVTSLLILCKYIVLSCSVLLQGGPEFLFLLSSFTKFC